MSVSDRAIAISVGAFAAVAYLIAGAGLATDYDYFGRLAAAFLEGRWWLTLAPPWLNELIPCGDGRWCVVFPPLPAVLTMPFVPLFGTAKPYSSIVATVSGRLRKARNCFAASLWADDLSTTAA